MKFRTAKNKNGIIIGMLLGDSYLNKYGALATRHCLQQEEYLNFKVSVLENFFAVTKNRIKVKKTEKKEAYEQVGFRIKTTPYLKLMKKNIYTPKKTFTMRHLKKLTPLGIAIWYMDDGSTLFQKNSAGKIESRKGYLNTQGYTKEENEIMKQYFKETFDIKCEIHKDKIYYRLYFNSTELKKLIKIISPFIIDSMKYKICMRYGKNKATENLCKKECSKNCVFNIL